MTAPHRPPNEPTDLAAKIVERDERPFLTLVKRPPWQHHDDVCKHEHVVIDDKARRLSCDDCSVDLDPIAYIAGLARKVDHWRREAQRLNDARQEWREHEILVLEGKIKRHRVHPGLSGSRPLPPHRPQREDESYVEWAAALGFGWSSSSGECATCHQLRSEARKLQYVIPSPSLGAAS